MTDFVGMSVQQYEELIASKNKAWKKASKQRKRVWLAKDVLAQLDAKYFQAMKGQYITEPDYAPKSVCAGCALGGLLTACTLRNGGGTAMKGLVSGRHIFSNEIRERLSPLFDDDQLNNIEVAFEGTKGVLEYSVAKYIGDGIPTWTGQERAEQRMRIIMANIINNKGTFNYSYPPTALDYKVAGLTR